MSAGGRGLPSSIGPRGWVILALTLLVAGSACSRERRHSMLDFFFDGVPPVDAPAPGASPAAPVLPETSEERIAALGYELEVRTQHPHEPYRLRECHSCHAVSGRTQRLAGSWVQGTAVLIEPVGRLCFSCHEIEAPHQHGPAAAGQCILCHHPHTSPNPHLLRNAEPDRVCQTCHLVEDLAAGGFHEVGALDRSCLECHDPHGGTRPRFLRGPAVEPGETSDPSVRTIEPRGVGVTEDTGDEER